MKFLKNNKILTASFILCLILTLLAGVFSIINIRNTAASADTVNSDLKFVLNSVGDGYQVSAANRQLIEADIPEEYNGLPVVEVATNGFTSCANLKYVRVPNSINKIGANAFANCKNLQKLRGMMFVTEIGNNAFAMCTNLVDLIIPPKVEKLGSNIIRNISNDVYSRCSEMTLMTLNSSWNANSTAKVLYGNDLTCTEVYEGEELVGFSINEWQSLSCPEEDLVLICSHQVGDKYYPIIEIADSAFICSSFKSLTLKYDAENVGTDYVVDVLSNAFHSVEADFVSIEVDINLKDDTESVFASSTISSVTLPYTLDKISPNMFQYCGGLSEIKSTNTSLKINQLSENITYIGNNAFDGCCAMSNLYLPESVTFIGNYAFNSWGSGEHQTIDIDLYGPQNTWDVNWCSDISSNIRIKYKPVTVFFEMGGGSGGTSFIEVEYGQPMPNITKPERTDFDFKGYYTEQNGNGVQYYDKNANSVINWDRQTPTLLYAYWKSNKDIKVSLNPSGGDGDIIDIIVKLNDNMPNAPKPVREGYSFLGYFEYPNGYGTQYYTSTMESNHVWNKDVDESVIYANWEACKYTVILYDGLTIEVTYGEPMPKAEVPVRSNFIFQGYFSEEDGDGTQYYSEDMQSLHNWDIASDNVTLYPKWIGQYYDVYFIPTEGSSDLKFVTVEYSKNFPSLSSKDAPKAVGYTFKGYYTDWHGGGEYIYDSNMQSTEFKYFDTSIKVLSRLLMQLKLINYLDVLLLHQ